jgi:ribonucrease Y
MNTIIYVLLSLVAGVLIGYIIRLISGKVTLASAENKAKEILKDAEKEVATKRKEVELELKDQVLREKNDFDKEIRERRNEVQILEKRLIQKEENLDKKADIIEKKEQLVLRLEKEVAEKEKKVQDLRGQYQKELERISGLSHEEARKLFLKQVEEECRHESVKLMDQIEDEARKNAEKKAREIVALAIQKNSFDYVSELTVSTVNLPGDEMKGRIIGREGRNIRTLENETGVDVIIDDTPEAVVISSFDPIRREVAKLSIERLMSDGRIHPARIEEVVKKVRKEVDTLIKEEGEKTVFEFGLQGVNPDMIEMLGKLKYRTSYGQNMLQHSREVALISGSIAAELNQNVKIAIRAGLFHDIGKVVSYEVEGAHAILGGEIAKKYHENPIIVNAISAHHGESEGTSIIATIVTAADAISAARPGARRENIENYLKRLEDIEQISNSFEGVSKSYAIQAGREVRIMVENEKVDDEAAKILARAIADKIQNELNFPGMIKVTVIRETRVVEYAK